ncbi:unnamed protein product [Ostreobium quekettii]|uniref:Uncharacterized protein n=1 Tax=Ostreobium quekettii TaxID=121088 RepID=A0A8S1ITF6_9CHLO|nr:unnamed protein product [Ostreobium quekettii]
MMRNSERGSSFPSHGGLLHPNLEAPVQVVDSECRQCVGLIDGHMEEGCLGIQLFELSLYQEYLIENLTGNEGWSCSCILTNDELGNETVSVILFRIISL